MTGLVTPVLADLPAWEFWRVTPSLHRRLFVGDVHGGTLVYRRTVWERHARYPDSSLAEDAAFLLGACRRGARLQRLPRGGTLHLRPAWAQRLEFFHAGSTSTRQGGSASPSRLCRRPIASFTSNVPWLSETPRQIVLDGKGIHWWPAARGENEGAPRRRRSRSLRASCQRAIGDTFSAVRSRGSERQDYRERELLILDDGDRLRGRPRSRRPTHPLRARGSTPPAGRKTQRGLPPCPRGSDRTLGR